MKSLAQRRIQVCFASMWTLGVRLVYVVLEFLNQILVQVWERKYHLRNCIKSSRGRHRSNTDVNVPSKQVNIILFKSRKRVLL